MFALAERDAAFRVEWLPYVARDVERKIEKSFCCVDLSRFPRIVMVLEPLERELLGRVGLVVEERDSRGGGARG